MVASRVDALNSNVTRIKRLRSEIAQLEARYDDSFPPGVFAVLVRLRRELAKLSEAR
jgi:hypothetical protein